MLDGLDNFWRARMWDDLSKLDAGRARQGAALYPQWAEAGAKLSGVEVVRGFNATMAIRAAAAKLFCDLDYVISPVSPVVNFAAELAAPINDPDKAVRAHRLHRAVEHGGESGAVDQWRLRAKAVSDRRPDRRPPLRRSSACSEWQRRSRACAARNSRGRSRRSDHLRHSGARAKRSEPRQSRILAQMLDMDCRVRAARAPE